MAAWKSIDVTRQLPALRRYARSLTRDETAADDLVQDALLRAYERAATFRPERSLKAWLAGILHNQFVSGQRRRTAEQRRDERFAQLLAASMNSADQEQAVYLQQIAVRFDALPEQQRAALHLIAVDGLTYQEAAEALQVPIGTIMSRLSRARAALRQAETPAHAPHSLRVAGGTDAS